MADGSTFERELATADEPLLECQNCKWFVLTHSGLGECRRHPPQIRHPELWAVFPLVAYDCFCGEFDYHG